jgi:predicted signal transduction protein with EAL and GGDEF domain
MLSRVRLLAVLELAFILGLFAFVSRESTGHVLGGAGGIVLAIVIDYSSLSYLRQLPLDALKIDRSFVRDLDHDASAITVARSIILLGHSLGLSIVAEGVEQERQVEILGNLDCDAAQGYLFSRPQPAVSLAGLLASGSI